VLNEKNKTTEQHHSRNTCAIHARQEIGSFVLSRQVPANKRHAAIRERRLLAFFGCVGDNSLTDIKPAGERRQRTEDEQLEDNKTVMNPVSLTVSDVV
jgi:hypothetical protein